MHGDDFYILKMFSVTLRRAVKTRHRRQIDKPKKWIRSPGYSSCESCSRLMSFWNGQRKTRSKRWRGFNKTTNGETGRDEEQAGKTLFHLLNLIMEIDNTSDCFAEYRCVYVCVFSADDWGCSDSVFQMLRTRLVSVVCGSLTYP